MEDKETSEYVSVIRYLRSARSKGLTLPEAFELIRGEQPWYTSIDQMSKRLARRGLPKARELFTGALCSQEWERAVATAISQGVALHLHQEVSIPIEVDLEDLHLESDEPLVDPPLMGVDRNELERTLILPDLHIPYEDALAFALVMKVGKALRPHRIIDLGDLADFYAVSFHDKDPKRLSSLAYEVGRVKERVEEIADLKAERNIVCGGNHEYRLTRYLERAAPPLVDYFNIPDLFGFTERGWTYVPYRRHIKVGKFHATHEVGFSGVHAAHATLQAFGHSIVFGHSHQLNARYLGNIVGERFVAVNAGWLGDPYKADYAHEATRRFWQTGFAVAYTDLRTGRFSIEPIPIIKYECVVGGKLFALR